MMAILLLAVQISAGAIVARAKEVDLKIRDLSARAHMKITSQGTTKERVFDLMLLRDGVNVQINQGLDPKLFTESALGTH